jgi:hypothetical protein
MRSQAVLFGVYVAVVLGGLTWFALAGLGRL